MKNSAVNVKIKNYQMIMNQVRTKKITTKTDLMHDLHLSFSTVSNLCNELQQYGYLDVEEGLHSSGGRRPSIIKLNSAVKCFIILKFSNSIYSYEIELINFNFQCISSNLVDYRAVKSLDSLLELIGSSILNIIKDSAFSMEDLIGIGIDLPGVYDKKRDVVFTPERKMLHNTNLRQRFQDMYPDKIVILENDANLIALGQCVSSNSSIKNSLVMYFTHGVGVGILHEGAVFKGNAGYAGEIGHLRSAFGTKECPVCHQKGCFQTLATIRCILAEYYAGIYDMEYINQNYKQLIDSFSDAVNSGDKRACEIMKTAAESIGDIIGGLIDLFNPEIVGLCGNYINLLEDFLETIRSTTHARSYTIDNNDTPIVTIHDYQFLMSLGSSNLLFDSWFSSDVAFTS